MDARNRMDEVRTAFSISAIPRFWTEDGTTDYGSELKVFSTWEYSPCCRPQWALVGEQAEDRQVRTDALDASRRNQ